MNWEDVPCYFWSDSTTALAWIQRDDHWGTFVGNQVREIIKLSNSRNWCHVPGVKNPADLPSRGCSPRQLLESKWWKGPKWLLQAPQEWPVSEASIDEDEINSEKKKITRTLVVLSEESWFKLKFSEYLKNLRVMGWIRRFIRNSTVPKSTRLMSFHLSLTELRTAERDVMRFVQKEVYPNGMDDVKGVKVKLGEDGLLRIKTRLTYRTDSLAFRQPIVLPRNHSLVEKLIRYIHVTNCHAGIQFVLGRLREKYWVLQGRKAVGKVIHECIVCKRYSVQSLKVEPAPLPKNRVESGEAFQRTGVDLAGPLFLKNGEKAWIVLFTCAVYRSIHLDLVTSLSTEAFLGSLERFINTQGRPDTIYSDNGTNFVGAVNLFKRLDRFKIEKECRVKMIQWIFNPPTAAWWGGWWERLVRSIKELLRRMLGHAKLSYEELRTCLSAVQSTINNRPLTTLTEDVDDLIPLTPSMFTRGLQTDDFPEGPLITSRDLQSQYKRIQDLKRNFQARFRREYLALLVQKSHEKQSKKLRVGDIVLMGADNKKRFDWPMGRIVELISGRDGHVRVAVVKTPAGTLKRPLQRLYALEIPCAKEEFPIPIQVKKVNGKKTISPNDPEITEPETRTKSGRKIIRPNRYGQWNF